MYRGGFRLKRLTFVNARYREHTLSKDDFRRIERVKELIPPNVRVMVDVGCFDGKISALLRRHESYLLGLELSKEAAHTAKTRIDEVILCDIEEGLPLRNHSVDLIYVGELIEHLFDPDYFLEEVKRCLKEKGWLIITTPNLAGLGSRLSLLIGRKPWMIKERLKEGYAGHIRYFTLNLLKNLLEEHDFIIDQATR